MCACVHVCAFWGEGGEDNSASLTCICRNLYSFAEIDDIGHQSDWVAMKWEPTEETLSK